MGEKRYGLCRQYCAGSCMDKAPGQRELDWSIALAGWTML
jgi:hypothetical protein